MKYTEEIITPARAEQILKDCDPTGYNYRASSQPVINRYALDMAHGRWRLNGEAIKFDQNGLLVDGRQRLLACVKANESFPTALIRGVESEQDVNTMDWGKKRSLGDVLKRQGEVETLMLSSAINLLWAWEADQLYSGIRPSPLEALSFLERNPNVRDAVRKARTYVSKLRMMPSVACAFSYRAQEASIPDEVGFRQRLLSGQGVIPNDPVVALHNYLTTGPGSRLAVYRADQITLLAVFIKAWNAYIRGKAIKNMSFRRGGASSEPFPIMIQPQPIQAEAEEA